MKKILVGTLALGLVAASSVAMASPLTKIEAGKGKVDGAISISPTLKSQGQDLDGKTRYRLGATYGIADNVGVEYRYIANAGKHDSSVQSHQLNLMYQFNPNIAGFVGYVRNKGKVGDYNHTEGGYQVGVQGAMPIADRTSAWARFGIGSKITDYEIGVGYDLGNNFDLNLFYNDTKYKGFDDDVSFKAHGVNLGVTYKF